MAWQGHRGDPKPIPNITQHDPNKIKKKSQKFCQDIR